MMRWIMAGLVVSKAVFTIDDLGDVPGSTPIPNRQMVYAGLGSEPPLMTLTTFQRNGSQEEMESLDFHHL